MDAHQNPNLFVPSGASLTAKSGAAFNVSTEGFNPSFSGQSPSLVTGSGDTNLLVARLFGWDDPYYVEGSDLAQQVVTAGWKYGDNANDFKHNIVKSSVSLPNGNYLSGIITNGEQNKMVRPPDNEEGIEHPGIYQNMQSHPHGPPPYQTGVYSGQQKFHFNPIVHSMDYKGNRKKGFLFNTSGQEGIVFPQMIASTFACGGTNIFDVTTKPCNEDATVLTGFLHGVKGDPCPGYGWTICTWIKSCWITGDQFGQSNTSWPGPNPGHNRNGKCWGGDSPNDCKGFSGAGPGCDLDWANADGTRMQCLDGDTAYPVGNYSYAPFRFGDAAGASVQSCGLLFDWQGGDSPSYIMGKRAGNAGIHVPEDGGDPTDNPPGPWDQLYRTGAWNFFALSYQGGWVADEWDVNNSNFTGGFACIGNPTGTPSKPNGREMAQNFWMYSGDGATNLQDGWQPRPIRVDHKDMSMIGRPINGPTPPTHEENLGKSWIKIDDYGQASLGMMYTYSNTFPSNFAVWPGMLSDFRIYSGALSTGQLFDIYTGRGTF